MVALTGIEGVAYRLSGCHLVLSVRFCVHPVRAVSSGFGVFLRSGTWVGHGMDRLRCVVARALRDFPDSLERITGLGPLKRLQSGGETGPWVPSGTSGRRAFWRTQQDPPELRFCIRANSDPRRLRPQAQPIHFPISNLAASMAGMPANTIFSAV